MSNDSIFLAFLISSLLITTPSFAGSIAGDTTNQSFNNAKKALLREVYLDHRQTFYCGSNFDGKGRITPFAKGMCQDGGM